MRVRTATWLVAAAVLVNRAMRVPPDEDTAGPLGGLEVKDVVATQAAWAVHLHQQVHQYIRIAQTTFQILVTVTGAGVAAAVQSPNFRDAALVSLPYVVGFGVLNWLAALREVMTTAGIIVGLEDSIRTVAGTWVLLHETVLEQFPQNRAGGVAINALIAILVAGTSALSITWAFDHLAPGIAVINTVLIFLLLLAILVCVAAVRNAKSSAVAAYRRVADRHD